MPIYEYECKGCGDVFEVFQKHSDPPPEEHDCGSKDVGRIMSRTSFVLKGEGWYITDYGRKDQSGGKNSKSQKSDSDGEKKTDSDKKKAKDSASAA